MKKRQRVALVSGGKLTDSPLSRFWGLPSRLGPVKASSLRLASRMVNTLRAGHAVESYAEFVQCGLVLVCVPDTALSDTVSGLANSGVSWQHKAVVLCSQCLEGRDLEPLAALGASVGSVAPIPGFEDRRYLVEGDRMVVLEMKQLLEHRAARVVAVEPGLKPFYLASLTCSGPLLYSLLLAASECLQPARMKGADAAAIIEKQVERTLRAYFKAGRKAYQGPRELARQLEALKAVHPELAEYLEKTARLAANLGLNGK